MVSFVNAYNSRVSLSQLLNLSILFVALFVLLFFVCDEDDTDSGYLQNIHNCGGKK